MNNSLYARMTVITLAAMAVAAAGCTTTTQARSVQKSGFLPDYSIMKPGKEGQALLVYRNPDANIAKYNKILLDPVTVIRNKNSSSDVPTEELQKLGTDFYNTIKARLQADYEMVSTPGPGVMRIRVALTEADPSHPGMDLITTVVPIGLALSFGKEAATGTGTFVGQASAEVEVTDSEDGTLLMEAADRRAGGKSLGKGSVNSWTDVHNIFDYWAQRMKERLAQERAKDAAR